MNSISTNIVYTRPDTSKTGTTSTGVQDIPSTVTDAGNSKHNCSHVYHGNQNENCIKLQEKMIQCQPMQVHSKEVLLPLWLQKYILRRK